MYVRFKHDIGNTIHEISKQAGFGGSVCMVAAGRVTEWGRWFFFLWVEGLTTLMAWMLRADMAQKLKGPTR